MSPVDSEPPAAPGEAITRRVGSPAGERMLGWLLLAGAVVLVGLSLAPSTVTRFYTWPTILYWHGLLALPLVAFVVGAAARRPLPRLGLALDIGAFLWAAAALGAAWLSAYRPTSMPAAFLPVASVTLAYVMRGWLGFEAVASRLRAQRAFTVIGLLAAVVVVVSWVYWIVLDVIPAWQADLPWHRFPALRNAHPFGHPNHTAGFVVLMLPIFVGMAVTARGGGRLGWGGVALLALGLLLTTGSRGGVLAVCGLVGGLVVFAFTRRDLPRRTKLALGVGLFVGAIVLVALSPRVRDLWRGGAGEGNINESNRERIAMLEAGWAMGRDRPWLGHGPGTVSIIYPHYRARLSGGVENVLELHTAPGQVWAETGVVGVLALVMLAAGVGMRAWRLRANGSAVHSGTTDDRRRAWALVFALGGYAIFAVTDHQLDVPLFAGTLAVILALLSALTRPAGLADVTWSPTFVRAVPAAAVAAAGALIVWHIVPELRARHAFVTGVITLERGDAEGFRAGAQRARELAPWEPFYLNQLAFHHLAESDRASDEGRAQVLRAFATGALQRSLAVRPHQEICHLNLGWLALEAQHSVEAASHFRAAAGLVPDKGGVHFGLGLALLQQGREADAARAFALEWINDPRAIGREIWSRADWQERRRAVAAAAQAMLDTVRNTPEARGYEGRIAYAQALLAWWIAPTVENAARAQAAALVPEARLFFETLRGEADLPSSSDGVAWRELARLCRGADAEGESVNLPRAFAPWTEALARRAARYRGSPAAFFVTPVRADEGLIRSLPVVRLAYGMHARNSDGLRITDRTPREGNVVTSMVLAPVLPAKGWLSGPALGRLLAMVPE